jgi:hypothetical protein
MIPVISEWTHKVARVHGEHHPEAIEIAADFNRLAMEMNNHMAKEEKQAFPLIREMIRNPEARAEAAGRLNRLIDEMENEHEAAGEIMLKIRKLKKYYHHFLTVTFPRPETLTEGTHASPLDRGQFDEFASQRHAVTLLPSHGRSLLRVPA